MNIPIRQSLGGGKSHLKAVSWGVFWLLVLVSLCFQVQSFFHVGSFWRDEASTLALVEKSSLVDVYRSLEIDSYPPLYVVLLRGWKALGGGSSETGLRLFGFLAFPFILAAIGLAFRVGASAPPVIAAALLSFNPNVFYWSTALRAYGLATGLIILFFGAMLVLLRRTDRGIVAICVVHWPFSVSSPIIKIPIWSSRFVLGQSAFVWLGGIGARSQ